jgi:hypothetical protein
MGSGASFGDDARRAAALIDADVYVYNGALRPRVDLSFITVVDANVHREQALLVLTTNGGDPDAAYRIARYMQDRYATWSVLVAGRFKSAGTLLALGATELVFYHELVRGSSPGGEIRFDALSGRSVESVADAATEKEPSHVEIKPGRDTQSDVADHPRAGRASDAQASSTQRPSGADGSSDPQAAVPVAANG